MKSKLIRALEVILSFYCVLSLLFVLLSVGLIGWDRFDSRKTGEHRVLPDMLVAAETVDRYALIDKDNFEEQCTVLNEMIDFDIELSEQGYVYETAASKIVVLSMRNAAACLCIYLVFRAWRIRPRKVYGFVALGCLVIRIAATLLARAYIGETEHIVRFLNVHSLDFRYFDMDVLKVFLLVCFSIYLCGIIGHVLPDTNPAPEDLPPEKDDE